MQRSLNFNIGDKTYPVTFPTVGNMIDIDVQKIQLSKGQYYAMMSIPLTSTQKMLDLIDAQSILNVLCPTFLQDLKTPNKSLMELDIADSIEFLKKYNEQVVPWWIDINNLFQQPLQSSESE